MVLRLVVAVLHYMFRPTWPSSGVYDIFSSIYIKMNVCMFVPYAFLYHSSDCDETSVSCCAPAREGLWVTFLLLNIKTFMKSAKYSTECLGCQQAILRTTFVSASPEVGAIMTTCKYPPPPCLNRGRFYHDNNHPLSSGCLRGEREGVFRVALQRMPGIASWL
jgi:hypothetical protein